MLAVDVIAFAPLVVVLLLLLSFAAWVFIHSPKSYLLRWLLVPMVFVAAAFSAYAYGLRLGYAAPTTLPTKFVYLGHHIVVVQGEKVGIEVWAQTRNTRLYRIPFSQGAEKAMDAAKVKGKRGSVVMTKEGEQKEGKGDPYESNIVLPEDIDRK